MPVVNIVGDHAYRVKYDAQLQSDIETVVQRVSRFVRTSQSTEALCQDATEAITTARVQAVYLILPADVSWGEGGQPCAPLPQPEAQAADDAAVQAVKDAIASGQKTALLLGGRALREPALIAAAALPPTVALPCLPKPSGRGAGLPPIERSAYLAELATLQLSEFDHLVLVDAKAPVSFFGYPGKQSYLVPDNCTALTLSTPEQDAAASLNKLAEALGAAGAEPKLQAEGRPGLPKGKLTAEKVCRAMGELMPENSIIVDESITSGLMLNAMTAGAPRHDMITLTGGAIGQGLPKPWAPPSPARTAVFALIGDGTAMYTIQALWTMARENLNVTSIIFNNASYSILNVELERVGAEEAGAKAKSQLDISGPVTHYAQLAQSMGVHGVRVRTAEELIKAMEYAQAHPGPHLIEAVVPESLNGVKRKVLPWLLKSLPSLPRPLTKALKKKIAP